MGLRSLLCIGSKKPSTPPNANGNCNVCAKLLGSVQGCPTRMAGFKDKSVNQLVSGVSSSLQEVVNATWTIENFELVVRSAKSKLKSQGTGSVNLGENCQCKLWLGSSWGDQHKVQVKYVLTINTTDSDDEIGMHLRLAEPKECSLPEVLVDFMAQVSVNGKTTILIGDDSWNNFGDIKIVAGRGCRNIFKMSEVKKHLDSQGAITFDIMTVYIVLPKFVVELKQKESRRDLLTPSEHLQKEVERLFGDQMTSDITIKVLDSEEKLCKSFHAHKAILAARSPVFRAMLCNSETKESQSGVVEVSDVSVETMELFLEFLYKGQLKHNSDWIAHALELVYIADKYDVKSLMEFCGENLTKSVTVENALEMLELAKRHGLGDAATDIRGFIFENIRELV